MQVIRFFEEKTITARSWPEHHGACLRKLMRSLVLLITAAVYIASPAAASQQQTAAAIAAQPVALTVFNNAFRQVYADARNRVLAGTGPVIVVNGDNAILLRNGQRIEASVNAPVYHWLKAIAHIPLAVYVTLTPGEGPLDDERIKTLGVLRQLIPPAHANLAELGLSAPVLARQDRIITESLAFLDATIARRSVQRNQTEAFARAITPLVMANVTDATQTQLKALHDQVSRWQGEIGPAEWKQVHVVITGAHMQRDGEVRTQYFSRLLDEPSEGHRIVYAESLWEEPAALDLLGTHLLDSLVAEAFFGDVMRMHRDLLGDAGRDYLPQILPR